MKQGELFKTKLVPAKPGSGKLFEEVIVANDGPVVCLGQEFENDEARRQHFTALLREKLKDPEFRKIEGFPIGEDEDILALSDPPYYTACPNPWIGDFIKEWEKARPQLDTDEPDRLSVPQRAVCGGCERREERPNLQRALLSHQGAA